MEKMELTRNGCPALRVLMFPKDTNPSGNIFGGVILSHVDVAAGIAARSATRHRVVTRSFKEAEFKKPVKIGDLLTCWAWVTRVGTSSITTRVVAEVERNGEYIKVTEAEVVYVSVDESDRPIPIDSPPGTQGKDKPVTPPVEGGGDSKGAVPAEATGTDTGAGGSCGDVSSEAGADGCSCNHADEGHAKGKKSKKRSRKEKKRAKKEAKRTKKRAKKAENASADKGSGCLVCQR